jgi:hypothetical protein
MFPVLVGRRLCGKKYFLNICPNRVIFEPDTRNIHVNDRVDLYFVISFDFPHQFEERT